MATTRGDSASVASVGDVAGRQGLGVVRVHADGREDAVVGFGDLDGAAAAVHVVSGDDDCGDARCSGALDHIRQDRDGTSGPGGGSGSR